MKPAPMFMFACAVAAISGAVGGAAINTTPIQKAGVGAPDFTREPAMLGFSEEPEVQPALPDHYEMVTPTGRIEVAELTANGLYSQRRFGWRETIALPPPAPPIAEPLLWDEVPPEPEVEFADDHGEDRQPKASEPEVGGARLIQVAADGAATG